LCEVRVKKANGITAQTAMLAVERPMLGAAQRTLDGTSRRGWCGSAYPPVGVRVPSLFPASRCPRRTSIVLCRPEGATPIPHPSSAVAIS
jgi:hypothetical protein